MGKREKLAVNGMLFSAAMLWGSSYSYRKIALLFMGPFFFNAWRFFLGFIVLFFAYLVSDKVRKGPAIGLKPVKWQVQKGFLIGTAFSAAVTVQQLGLITSDVGKCGFISTLYIFFTPIISWLILKRRVPARIWVGVGVAAVGLFFISMGDNFVIVIGDVLYLISAVLYAVQIILIGNYITQSNPILLVSIQMFTCSVMNAVLAVIFESDSSLASLSAAIWPIVYTGVVTIAIGNLLQFIAQKKANPSVAAIILSMESVFAALFAAIIISERMNAPQIAGCCLIFSAIILSQIEKP